MEVSLGAPPATDHLKSQLSLCNTLFGISESKRKCKWLQMLPPKKNLMPKIPKCNSKLWEIVATRGGTEVLSIIPRFSATWSTKLGNNIVGWWIGVDVHYRCSFVLVICWKLESFIYIPYICIHILYVYSILSLWYITICLNHVHQCIWFFSMLLQYWFVLMFPLMFSTSTRLVNWKFVQPNSKVSTKKFSFCE